MPTINMKIGDTEIDADVKVVASSEKLDDEQWRVVINWLKLSIKIDHAIVRLPFI